MTPQEYIDQLRHFIRAGEHQAALDFSALTRQDVAPALDADQFDLVCGMLEGAAMSVSL